MKVRIGLAVAAVALGSTLGMAGSAFAASPSNGTAATANGWAMETGTAGPAPLTVVNVGGGTWHYWSGITWNGREGSFSDYINNTVNHTSSAFIGGCQNTSRVTAPGNWADSSCWGWPWETASQFWNNL